MDQQEKRKEAYLLSSVNHSLKILDLLMVRDGLRLKEISELLELDRTSTYKMLYTLMYRRFVFKDSKARYHLGNKLAPCRQLSESRHQIAEISRPFIVQLWAKTKKTVVLGTLGLDNRLTILSIKLEPQQVSITGRVGADMEIHTSGLGKVLLAFLEPELRETTVSQCSFVRKTENTITDHTEVPIPALLFVFNCTA